MTPLNSDFAKSKHDSEQQQPSTLYVHFIGRYAMPQLARTARSTFRLGRSLVEFLRLGLIALCVSLPVAALETDRRQPITIDADSAERDEIAGTTTYAGNVQMAQGSMRINADRIIIHNTRDKVTKIVARGKPATYQQKPNTQEGLVVAKAQTLEYRIDQETLRLLESASLKQEGTSLSGNRIEYDVRRSVVKAGSNAEQSERVRMIIPPKALMSREDETEVPASTAPTLNTLPEEPTR